MPAVKQYSAVCCHLSQEPVLAAAAMACWPGSITFRLPDRTAAMCTWSAGLFEVPYLFTFMLPG